MFGLRVTLLKYGMILGHLFTTSDIPTSVEFPGLGKVSTGIGGPFALGGLVNSLSWWLIGGAGFIAGLVIVINGIKLMTAGGDGNKIKEGINGIRDALIGFLLALLATGIVRLIDSIL